MINEVGPGTTLPTGIRLDFGVAALFGAFWLTAPVTAEAAGFGIDFESARLLGTATAGSASAADASTIFYNPAGLSSLGNEIMAGGQLFLLHDRFQDGGSSILGGALPAGGGNGNDAIPTVLVPWLFASHRISPEWTVGLGIYSPFGLKTDYGPLWAGRYQNEVTSLTAININPTVAWQPTQWLSVGAGLDIQYVSVRLTQAIDFGSACAATLGPAICGGGFGLVPGASDGQVDNRGSGFGYGANFGVMIKPWESTRLAVSYRTQIDNHISGGRQSFDVPAGARAFLAAGGTPLALTGASISTAIKLPGRLTFGVRQALTKDLDLLLDATLTFWDAFDKVDVTAANLVTGASVVLQQGYRNSWRFAAGLNYHIDDRWEVRGGVAYDQTPIRKSVIQAALPDADRVYLSAGASIGLGHGLSADIGYTHVFYVEAVPINRIVTGNTLKGTFSSGGDIVSGQLRLRY